MSKPAAVTVITRTKNSAWVLGQTLSALFSQDFEDFQLHIVDSGSEDNTLEIARRFPCKITEIEAQQYFPGKVLNSAIEQCQSPLIVFLNSDTVLMHQRALGKLVAAFEDNDVQAAYGRQVARPEARPWVKQEYLSCFPKSGNSPSWITLSLPFAAMRRVIWEKRPFYCWAWGSEDTEWGAWAQKEGHCVRYVPSATAMHSHNYNLSELYGRKFIEGEADAFIYPDRPHPWYHMVAKILKGCALESKAYLKAWDPLGLPSVPLRQCVDHWAYYVGHCWGTQRLSSGNQDAAVGQDTVLKS